MRTHLATLKNYVPSLAALQPRDIPNKRLGMPMTKEISQEVVNSEEQQTMTSNQEVVTLERGSTTP